MRSRFLLAPFLLATACARPGATANPTRTSNPTPTPTSTSTSTPTSTSTATSTSTSTRSSTAPRLPETDRRASPRALNQGPEDGGEAATAGTPTSPPSLPFIDDDYPRALAEARASHRPLFVDAWAPWCHTCMSMRSYVFPDPAMQAIASRFVWLAIDTEKDQNAAFLAKYPMEVWPTLWVVDPATEKPALKWLGSATAQELAPLLEGAAASVLAPPSSGADAEKALGRGDRASAARRRDEAIREYRAALAAAPQGWKERPRLVEALSSRLSETLDHASCVDLALAELPKLPEGTSRTNVALNALACARALPRSAPGHAAGAKMLAELSRIADDRSVPLLADDRSSVYDELVSSFAAAGDKAEARRAASAWALFLEDEAQKAGTPEARAVFDPHRLLAYLALGEPARALPMLEASERDFPQDYNPPARLARAYLELRRVDDALAAIDRAAARAYGPRKMRVLAVKADILEAKGDRHAAASALGEAVKVGRSMQLGAGYGRLARELAARKARLESAPR